MQSQISRVVFVTITLCALRTVAGLFDQCNHVVNLQAGQKIYINSPYYPGQYPVGTSCRYTVKAPADIQLTFTCNIHLNTAPAATRCINEIFYFNREGSEVLSGSEYFCGSGKMKRKSFLNRAVISYISTHNSQRFLPEVTTEKTSETDQPITSTTPSSAEADSLEVDPTDHVSTEVSNALAYVMSLLSNTYDKGLATTVASWPAKAPAIPIRPWTKPESASIWVNYLPSFTWRNGSSVDGASTGTSRKRGKLIVDNGGFNGGYWAPAGAAGGGSFTCLVEAEEPECECGWSMITKVAGEALVAGINEFPSMAGVVTTRYKKIFCGASIIAHRYLLSAAHCFITAETNRSELIQVVVGENDLSTVFESLYTRLYDIDAIILHEYFRTTPTGVRNDIALLRTRIPIEWNRSVGPACLPFRSATGTDSGHKMPQAGQRVIAAGWGTTSFGGPQSSRLLKTTLDVISNQQCRLSMTSLPAGTFCTYTPGRDTCQYDSGGALYLRRPQLVAVGIVSYGIACASRQPSVNTKVASFIKWIKNKTPEVKYYIK